MLQKLVKWIAINQHPFTIVEEPNFVDFVHVLCPNAVLVSADTIKRKIMDLYESNVNEIQKALQMFQEGFHLPLISGLLHQQNHFC